MKMIEKAILLIDDADEQKLILKKLKKQFLYNESTNLITKYIDPNNREFWDEQKDPNIDKLIDGIKQQLSSIRPNLVVVDQYYSGNDKFKGLDVIAKLREISKFKKCTIFLISGKRDAIVRDIFNSEKKELQKVDELARIIGLRINKFLDKAFESEAINALKENNIEDILPEKLRTYEGENCIINKFSPKYNKITFEELAKKIECDSDDATEILDEMFDLTLSHYANINEKLK